MVVVAVLPWKQLLMRVGSVFSAVSERGHANWWLVAVVLLYGFFFRKLFY